MSTATDSLRYLGPRVIHCPECGHGIDPHGVDPGGPCGVGDAAGNLCQCFMSPNGIACLYVDKHPDTLVHWHPRTTLAAVISLVLLCGLGLLGALVVDSAMMLVGLGPVIVSEVARVGLVLGALIWAGDALLPMLAERRRNKKATR